MGRWISVAALLASSAWACSDDDDTPNASGGSGDIANDGGSGAAPGNRENTAGPGGVAGEGGVAGKRSDGGPLAGCRDCVDVNSCPALPIDECEGDSRCPRREVPPGAELCDNSLPYGVLATAYDTVCGGRVIFVGRYYGQSETWGYDAEGRLKYVATGSDFIQPCPDGKTQSGVLEWGEPPCERSGPVEELCCVEPSPGVCGELSWPAPLCDEGPACVKHDSCDVWGANFGCPQTPADMQSYCAFAAAEVRRYDADCRGTVYEVTNGAQSVTYTFNGEDQLVGAIARGDVGDCDQWGEEWARKGAPQSICGEGGLGGAGGEAGAATSGAAP